MVGQTVTSQRSLPWATCALLALALGLAVLGLRDGNVEWVVFAVLPLFVAGACWFGRAPKVVLRLTETAITVLNGPTIPYHAIQSFRVRGRPADPNQAGPHSYPFRILHSRGILLVPARLDVPSDDLYRFLFAQLGPSGSQAVGPHLANYLALQEKHFGPGQVRTYGARAYLGKTQGRRAMIAFGLALLLTAVFWLAIGTYRAGSTAGVAWIAMGVVLGFIGLVVVVLAVLDRGDSTRIKKWRDSALVVGPGGLGMVQGDVKGELRWDQVHSVEFNPKPGFFSIQTSRTLKGIHIRVAGAHIVVADVYDRPLYAIYQAIHSCWLRYQ